MSTKVFFTDLDGTLLNDQKEIGELLSCDSFIRDTIVSLHVLFFYKPCGFRNLFEEISDSLFRAAVCFPVSSISLTSFLPDRITDFVL